MKQRPQIFYSECQKAIPRLVLLGFKCGEQSLLLHDGDGIPYRVAACIVSG